MRFEEIEEFYWDAIYDQAISELIERGISDQRLEQITNYLGTYGDAVQRRIDRCILKARNLMKVGFPGSAVVSAVTAMELMMRYFVLRPTLEGAFLSDEWARIFVGHILKQRSAADRELLPAVLRLWDIELNTFRLPSGKPLWATFTSDVLPLRNNIVHKGSEASPDSAAMAIEIAESFLDQVVKPLSDRFGFSWSRTRCWNPTKQGVGGAKSNRHFISKSPFNDE